MVSFVYPARFEPDEEGRPVVSFPDFPGAHTDGRDEQEALGEAMDCLGSVLAARIAARADVPRPSMPLLGQRAVPVPLWMAGTLALSVAMRKKGCRRASWPAGWGWGKASVRRMLDPDDETEADRLEAALGALGMRAGGRAILRSMRFSPV